MNTYAWLNSDGKHCQQKRRGPPPPCSAREWICFDPVEHTYTDERGRVYLSGTGFVSRMDDQPFNAEKVAIECAAQLEGAYANMSPQEIMAQWESTADVGTECHEAIEMSIKGKWRNDDSDPLQPIVDQFQHWLYSARRGAKTKPERILWDRERLLCGTADVVSYYPLENEFIIDDVKTWRKLTDDRKKHAAEQVSLYAQMLTKLTGIPARVGGVIMFENYFDKRGGSVLSFVPLKERSEQIQPAIWAREYECRCEEEAMALAIKGGKTNAPERVVVMGVEGVGKSTFASRFPEPVFIDTEGSTDNMDVQRLPKLKTWTAVKQQLADIRDEKSLPFKTLVIDTIDAMEEMGAKDVAKSKNKKRLADVAWGRGELALAEEFKGILDILDDIQDKHKVHIVLTAHTVPKRFDPPDQVDAYDRYELKLRKHTSPLVREWCSLLLFANFVVETKETDGGKIKGVGDGTERVMFTTRTDAYDAKNRHGLDKSLPFAYKYIKHVIEGGEALTKETK